MSFRAVGREDPRSERHGAFACLGDCFGGDCPAQIDAQRIGDQLSAFRFVHLHPVL